MFLDSRGAVADLSCKSCSPFAIQTADDTCALSVGTTHAVVESGADSWFFITADFAFGGAIEAESMRTVTAAGGKVLGDALRPPGTADFAAYSLKAQASHSKATALANAGSDTIRWNAFCLFVDCQAYRSTRYNRFLGFWVSPDSRHLTRWSLETDAR